ncbi:hypothetical protein os1_29670 [Comamonadaceae bacterium OS-1]|nr:hypothetical protein os1_29670 [Comamonadaceae bacterium OS-1]
MQKTVFSKRIRVITQIVFFQIALILSGCAINMAAGVADLRSDLLKDLKQIDPEGQEQLRRAWYGRLLSEMYGEDPVTGISLRKQFSEENIKNIEKLLQIVTNNSINTAESILLEKSTLSTLKLPTSFKTIKIIVQPEVSNRVSVYPDCKKSTIEFSIKALQRILQIANNLQEVNDLQSALQSALFEMMHIDATQDQYQSSKSELEQLFGPAQNKYLTKKLSQQLGAQGTVAWKAFSFIISHEAYHIWTNKCEREPDEISQREWELRADVTGSILAIATYNKICNRKIPITNIDVSYILGLTTVKPSVSREAILQMNLVGSSELIVGASGMETMLKALASVISQDPSHPTPSDRENVDQRGASLLATRLFGEPARSSVVLSIIGKLMGVPHDQLIEMAYQDLEFKPNWRSVNGLVLCTNINFTTAEKRNF